MKGHMQLAVADLVFLVPAWIKELNLDLKQATWKTALMQDFFCGKSGLLGLQTRTSLPLRSPARGEVQKGSQVWMEKDSVYHPTYCIIFTVEITKGGTVVSKAVVSNVVSQKLGPGFESRPSQARCSTLPGQIFLSESQSDYHGYIKEWQQDGPRHQAQSRGPRKSS